MRQSKQATLNINGSLLSRDPSLIHLLYSQEKSLWKIRTDLQSAACPLIAAPSRGHSEPVSLFSCCPTVCFFSHSLGEFPTQDLFGRQTQTHCNLGSSAASASHVITGQEVKGLNQEKAQL